MTRKNDHHSNKLLNFMRSPEAVWLVEFLLLFVFAVVVYNDWDAPVRSFIFPSSSFTLPGSIVVYGTSSSVHDCILKLAFFLVYATVSFLIATIIANAVTHLEICKRIESLQKAPMQAEDFLNMRNRMVATRMLSDSEFTGVYILHNVTKDMYYVGQSVRVLSRINQHLTGHGNGDVYADFKYGDNFTVSTIPIQGSGYQSLNDLERDAISAYNAKDKGYNMTCGNQR